MPKSIALRLAAIPAFVAATTGSAMAALPANVTGSLTNLSADSLEIAGIVLAAIVAVFAFKFMRRGL